MPDLKTVWIVLYTGEGKRMATDLSNSMQRPSAIEDMETLLCSPLESYRSIWMVISRFLLQI